MTKKFIVKFIDDDPADAKLYKKILEGSGQLLLELIDPKKFTELTDYDKILFDSPKAVIIDQKIAMYAGVTYNGLDIAELLRSLNPLIPIFILTNFQGETDASSLGWSVENVIPKEHFKTKDQIMTHLSRILRSIGRYEEALSEKTKLFNELLNKKISGKISDTEEHDLNKIMSEIEAIFSIREAKKLGQIKKTEDEVETLNRILCELKKLSKDNK